MFPFSCPQCSTHFLLLYFLFPRPASLPPYSLLSFVLYTLLLTPPYPRLPLSLLLPYSSSPLFFSSLLAEIVLRAIKGSVSHKSCIYSGNVLCVPSVCWMKMEVYLMVLPKPNLTNQVPLSHSHALPHPGTTALARPPIFTLSITAPTLFPHSHFCSHTHAYPLKLTHPHSYIATQIKSPISPYTSSKWFSLTLTFFVSCYPSTRQMVVPGFELLPTNFQYHCSTL